MRVLTDNRLPLRVGARDRILVYFPHGLGDWAQLGYVTPLLDAKERIGFTRVGDDFVCALEGAAGATALRSGVAQPDGPVHRPRPLRLPPDALAAAAAWHADVGVWPEFHDRGGNDAFPFHTKARRFARALVPAARVLEPSFEQPLRSGLAHAPPADVARAVEPRLRAFVPAGNRLCVLVRGGRSDPFKTWGHAWRGETADAADEGAEARAFVAALGAAWRVVTFEDALLGAAGADWPGAERVIDWATLAAGAFGEVPFALALRAVLARADLVVGVPAGPFHLAHARADVPVVGIWLHQHPDWYEEPHALARHLVGQDVIERRWHRKRASRTLPPQWRHAIDVLPGHNAPAEAVLAAAAALGAL